MDTLGYNVAAKFPTLRIREQAPQNDFVKKIRGSFSGLVLYHGNPLVIVPASGGLNLLNDIFIPTARSARCAILIVDTTIFQRPKDCDSPYIHFYSVSVPNRDPNPFEKQFQALVDDFDRLTAMPDERSMEAMWNTVDPDANRLMQLEFLERALCSRKNDTNDTEEAFPTEWSQQIEKQYGPHATYSQLLSHYRDLCERDDLKKN